MSAKKLTIELEVQTGASKKQIDNLKQGVEKFNNEVQTTNKKATKGFKGLGNAVKNTGKSFKGLGLALKAAGIGLAIAAFAKLVEVFKQNQTIVDGLSVAFGTVSTVVTKFVNAIIDAGSEFTSLGDIFKNSVMIPINAFKTSIFAIQTGLLRAQLAWEKSFLGGQDADKIKELQADIDRVDEKVGNAASGLVNNVIGIGKGFVQTGKELGDFTTKAVENVSKISATQELANQERIQQLKKETEIALAENDKLQFEYQLAAERQRQIRDDVTASIEDRIKANDKLKSVLEEQSKLQLENANKALELAKAELQANPKLLANKVALIEAEKNVLDVKENIAGFESEQRVNREGLELEQIELINSRSEAENARFVAKKRFNAEEIDDEILKLEELKRISEEEEEIESKRLQAQIDRLGEGTQARQDAEQQFLDFKQEKDLEQQELDSQRFEALQIRKLQEAELKQKEKEQVLDNLETIRSVAGEESRIGRAIFIAKQAMLVKEQIMEAKATLARITMRSAEAGVDVAKGAASTAKVGFPQNVPLLIAFAAQAAGIIAAVASAAGAAKSSVGSAGGGGGSASTAPAPPAFNIVGAAPENQLAETINNQQQKPVKAFVVSSDVSTAQSLDRNIVEGASI
jgi:hypothetical protein